MKAIKVLVLMTIYFSLALQASAALELLQDPFFRRYDLASEIIEGTLIESKPALKRIQDDLFQNFPDEAFMTAKIKVTKSWKGKLKPGQVAEFRFVKPPKIFDYRAEQISFDRYEQKKGQIRVFLRTIDRGLVGSFLFGVSPIENDLKALEAMRERVPEIEVVKRMEQSDQWFYKRQLRKSGKIDRLAEEPQPEPTPPGVSR